MIFIKLRIKIILSKNKRGKIWENTVSNANFTGPIIQKVIAILQNKTAANAKSIELKQISTIPVAKSLCVRAIRI
jgi:hypothetical protein